MKNGLQNSVTVKGEITNKWLIAAVLGGLWASIEIIVGSFLHNLKIPLSGSFLTMISIILAVGFFQIWPVRGILWRAGLICAIMKSISPSAVILGPMTAIAAEGFLLELGIFLFGRNPAGFMFSGAITLLSAFIHKVLRLLIVYGMSILEIYLAMFRRGMEQFGIFNADPLPTVISLVMIYIIVGGIAGFIGFKTGQAARSRQMELSIASTGKSVSLLSDNFKITERYSTGLLITHLIAITGLLAVINFLSLTIAAIVTLPYILFCAFQYTRVSKTLSKSFFWIQLVTILILAWVFQDAFGGKANAGNYRGLIEGLKIIHRAVLIVVGFSSLSTELKNPFLQNLFSSKGLRQLYLSVNAAFGILPAIFDQLIQPKKFLLHPIRSISESLLYVESWMNLVEEDYKKSQTLHS